MNFEDYASQVTLKYQVAIATAVIKNKPKALTIEQYINRLINRINKMDFDHITTCSDDFKFDDDTDMVDDRTTFNGDEDLNDSQATNVSVNLLEGLYMDTDLSEEVKTVTNLSKNIKDCIKINKEDDTQTTFCEDIHNHNLLDGNIIIFDNLSEHDTNKLEKEHICSKDRNDKITSKDIDHVQNLMDSQQTEIYKYNNIQINRDNKEMTLFNVPSAENIRFDSQTELDVQDLTENTHISQSQTNFIVVGRNVLYKTMDCPLKQNLNNETSEENAGIYKKIQNGIDKDIPIQTNKQLDKQYINNTEINTSNITQSIIHIENDELLEIDAIDNIEVQNSQYEIPFEVIEKLNRLKIYLDKKNKETDCSCSDSGYCDSQNRSSFKTHPQTSDTIVNSIARSLLDVILKGPLMVAAKDIISEISWLLGRLIDQLYVEEKYFLFLEEILSSIDAILKDIYEGESDDNILQKDTNINRLFLLNRSSHIIKYTIEKITHILERYLSQITNDSLEINIKETDNLSYILHILEYLLKRYIIIKNKNTQTNTQNSQEEKYLKKSSISDIWRKKWNPNYKTIKNDCTVDTKCIEDKCMEVLNKIIVQAMEGYSLISFAALQCFNLLQS